jgi:hypothetical protein
MNRGLLLSSLIVDISVRKGLHQRLLQDACWIPSMDSHGENRISGALAAMASYIRWAAEIHPDARSALPVCNSRYLCLGTLDS